MNGRRVELRLVPVHSWSFLRRRRVARMRALFDAEAEQSRPLDETGPEQGRPGPTPGDEEPG